MSGSKPLAVRTTRATVWLEICLWLAGCLALGYCAFLWGRAHYDQTQGAWALKQLSQRNTSPASTILSEGSLVGQIVVPRLNVAAVIFEGTSEETLERGVGHLTGSPPPGASGNLVLAAHRDTFFRRLGDIRPGDEVLIRAPKGESDYVVESTFVVNPDATEVLRPGNGSTLTLITCYPFGYIGAAPQRFIVRARKVRTKEVRA